MRTIGDEWEDYLNKVLPADASETQVKETHQAFMSGAAALIALLNSHSDEDGEKILEDLLTIFKDLGLKAKLLAERHRK